MVIPTKRELRGKLWGNQSFWSCSSNYSSSYGRILDISCRWICSHFDFLQVDYLFVGIYVLSMLFPAISAIFKEKIFGDAKEKLNGRTLDLFAVNSFGSAAQAVFVLLLLPVLSSLRGIPIAELPSYLQEGKYSSLKYHFHWFCYLLIKLGTKSSCRRDRPRSWFPNLASV